MSARTWLISALVLAALITAALAFGWQPLIFLGRKLAELIHWMAFWR